MVAVCIMILKARAGTDFRAVFLDVGQGDAILLQMKGASFLVDGGSSSVDGLWSRRISPALKYYGIDRLDGVFVTHGDSDHISGLREWLEGYETNLCGANCGDVSGDTIFLGAAASREAGARAGADDAAPDEPAAALGALAKEKGFQVTVLRPGQSVYVSNGSDFGGSDFGGSDHGGSDYGSGGHGSDHGSGGHNVPGGAGKTYRITCIYPSDQEVSVLQGDRNMCSMVLEVQAGDVRLILTGDLEKEGETALCARLKNSGWDAGNGDSAAGQAQVRTEKTILKVGHHGSANATSEALLELVLPDLAVISCGLGNSYGHPSQKVLQRLEAAGAAVWRTDLQGCCVVVMGSGSMADGTLK